MAIILSTHFRLKQGLTFRDIKYLGALASLYWTRGIYSFNKKEEFVWYERKSKDGKKNKGPSFNYTNWATDFPTKIKEGNVGVLINCTDGKTCKWENKELEHSITSTVMCESRLTPNYTNFSNTTRIAQIKEWKPSFQPPAQSRNIENNLPIIESCPETISIPQNNRDFPPLECWSIAANRHCYCFIPLTFTDILGEDGQRYTVLVKYTCKLLALIILLS